MCQSSCYSQKGLIDTNIKDAKKKPWHSQLNQEGKGHKKTTLGGDGMKEKVWNDFASADLRLLYTFRGVSHPNNVAHLV